MQEDAPKWSLVLEFIIVHLIYFAGSGIAIVVFTVLGSAGRRRIFSTRSGVAGMLLFSKTYWITVLGISVLVALFGPGMYQRHVMRGRGTLRNVKEGNWEDED